MKVLILSLAAGLASLGALVEYGDAPSQASLEHLRNSVIEVSQIQRVDAERRRNTDKIFRIIDRFNSQMPASTRQQLADEIIEASDRYPNLNVDLICATITHESALSWNPAAMSPAGAMGLMQVMPATGKWLAKIEGIEWTGAEDVLFNPVYNVRIGTRYLSAMIEMYDLEGGLAAYNGGGKRAALWLANNKADGILWAETQDYIPYVLKLYAEFRTL